MGFLLYVLISGGVGFAIGAGKGRPIAGTLLGFFLFILGWIIIALLPKTIEKQAEDQAKIRAILGDR